MSKRRAIEGAGAGMALVLMILVSGCRWRLGISMGKEMRRRIVGMTRALAAGAGLALLAAGCGPQFVESMLAPPWRDDSRHLTVGCASHPGNGEAPEMQFDADRGQLSDAQLTLLSAMRVGHRNPPAMITDGVTCGVDITYDGNLTSPHYIAATDDSDISSLPLIAFATFQPFLTTIPCLFSDDDGRAHPLAPDARCLNGIFLQPAPGNIDRFLTVSDASVQRHLELDSCDTPTTAPFVHLQLLLGDGSAGGSDTILAEGAAPPAPTPDHACQIIDYTFPAAGAYRMRVVVSDGVDLRFRFY